ncbi:hypothetical protein FHX57_007385 [Paraburkholderia tropica]|uniref:hypothetical protein n=1 Tax=Paraburkholderia tropica TaxID=92647 RepID=UPI00161B2AE1|nr:hypothetical protein [Paraburkholderia tropica]MBB3004998.1 hypothetical protein [Paraburkholderia tropica]MBB6323286.1 hypothetical protein [Paraburkholderia tropica]
MNVNVKLSVLCLIAVVAAARAEDQGTVADRTTEITDPVRIGKILHAIPAIQGSLADRLTAARLIPTQLNVTKLTHEDVADWTPRLHLKAGDTAIRIFTRGSIDGRVKVAGCELWDSPSILRHGATYFPDDMTSNWLLTGQCIAP